MEQDPTKPIKHRTLKSGRTLVEVDGTEYVLSPYFLSIGRIDTDQAVLEQFADSIRRYHPQASPEEYLQVEVDGLQCKYWAGDGLPMPQELEQWKQDVRDGKAVAYISDRSKTPYFYLDALAKANDMKRQMVKWELKGKCERKASKGTITITADPEDAVRFVDAELDKKVLEECHNHLCYMIRENGAKYADLLDEVTKNWQWPNRPEPQQMVLDAIAEVCELEDTLITELNTSIRNIAAYFGLPYSTMLGYYTEKYIFSTADQPKETNFIPYRIWKKIR